jgi:hypothetical protein
MGLSFCRYAAEIVAAAWAEQETDQGYMPPGVLGGP